MNNNPSPYEDIINLPRPISPGHRPMSRVNRAAQFSPFAALTGYDALVEETARLTEERTELDEQRKSVIDGQLQQLRERIADEPELSVVYFLPDMQKFGGEYVRHTGRLRRIDPFEGSLIFADGLRLSVENLYDIEMG